MNTAKILDDRLGQMDYDWFIGLRLAVTSADKSYRVIKSDLCISISENAFMSICSNLKSKLD